jgi:V/A-type H+/Na+-transporting ATPase subunit I
MLLPDKMTKILIVGSKNRIKETIDILYSLEALQPIDFSSEEEGFSLGSPLPVASEASQRLLKLRSAEKELEVVDKPLAEKISSVKIEDEIDDVLLSLDVEITGAVESKNRVQNRIHDLDAAKQTLEPFTVLPLDIDLYKGYENIAVFTGMVRSDPTNALNEALDRYELFLSSDAKFIAIFVAKEEAADAQRILIQHSFTEVPAPIGKGNPQEAMKAFDAELEALSGSLAEATEKIGLLRKKHEAFILASEEHLSIEVEKAEFPLRIGSTAHSFLIDAWVPQKSISQVQQELQSKLGDDVHIEVLEIAPRMEHLHPEEAHAGAEAHVLEEAPTRTTHKRPVNLFAYLTELISTPKYGEIDPTIMISITFPIFFGLMVGDIGYGIPFMALGVIGLRKCRSHEWKTISTMLLFGGIWATIFGFLLFGEAFGMHFGPQWVLEPGFTMQQLHAEFPLGNELSWSSLLGFQLPSLGVLSKLHDVKLLLYITIWIGFAHLLIGYLLGIYNESIRHGFKHAVFHKVGWTMILLGGASMFLFIIDMLILSKPVGLDDPRMLVGLALLLPGIIISFKGEGGQAILELPALMSNVVSYTRLAAIGMSKAGMALAFNMIAIEMVAPMGGIAIIAAIAIFMIGHLMIFILAVISAGIHGIRLHYVELFQKFYEGGGLAFNPLKIVRKYTSENTSER